MRGRAVDARAIRVLDGVDSRVVRDPEHRRPYLLRDLRGRRRRLSSLTGTTRLPSTSTNCWVFKLSVVPLVETVRKDVFDWERGDR